MKEKIAEIVAIASGVKPCEEECETDLCQINTTLACNRCLAAQLQALIEQEQKPMREALGSARIVLDLIANSNSANLSQVVEALAKIDAVLGGSHE
ncbi:MAG: hypothetical protein WC428_08055 [Candidatus Paceibacterota bacterium]